MSKGQLRQTGHPQERRDCRLRLRLPPGVTHAVVQRTHQRSWFPCVRRGLERRGQDDHQDYTRVHPDGAGTNRISISAESDCTGATEEMAARELPPTDRWLSNRMFVREKNLRNYV